ncbi:MAG: SAM-dependent chlorinase/fluorinase [Candidatus Kryptoniota bacterium]
MSLVVLLTDFGVRDHFVGVMKGVISQINPVLKVIDLTHDIEPQSVRQAAFVLWASRKFFPDDSIFVNVVDPGVGSERKIICGRLDNSIFLAPDNGLLDYVVAEANETDFYEVTNKKFLLSTVSTTFHGRDIFAPVAAYLSRGVRLNELGGKFKYPNVALFHKKIVKGMNIGEVMYHDHFGNVTTNFLWDDWLLTENSSLKIDSKVITRFYQSYSEGETKAPVCVKGSSGLIEIAVNFGNASRVLKSKIGQRVTLISK